jgi:hypothetical protein
VICYLEQFHLEKLTAGKEDIDLGRVVVFLLSLASFVVGSAGVQSTK